VTVENQLMEWIGQAAHPAVFIGLLSTGVPGLPIAEEAVMLAGGAATAAQPMRLVAMMAIAAVALLIADTVLFRIGAALGPRVFTHRLFSKLLTPSRVARVQRGYDKYGAWAIFFARFTPGLRMPSFVLAGAFGVRQSRFWLADGLGCCIWAPLVVAVGATLGPAAMSLVR
jgi:membrane protein DedA with SNARE-associated domain